MEKIHIFADSAADIPKEICEQLDIEIIPVSVTFKDNTFREYYDITPEEYWNLLKDHTEIPTTSQIIPTTYMETYKKAKENGYTHIIGVIINAEGSGSFQSACIARDLFYDEHGDDMKIELIDSETYSYVYGNVVVYAAEMRKQSETFDAIVAVIKSRLKRCEAFLGVYDLKHLKKSGRISGGAAFIGEALGLRPISHVINKGVNVSDKVRGDKNLIPKIIANVKKNVRSPETQTAYLLHGIVSDSEIQRAKDILISEVGFKDVQCMPLGVSITTNTGPYAIAVGFYGESH